MGSIKDRNGMDLTEAEDIEKRWQEYTEELYKKDLHDQDNHNGVITHLEPDFMECEIKWALGSITISKTSGGDGIPVELFQILKDDGVKLLHSVKFTQSCPTLCDPMNCSTPDLPVHHQHPESTQTHVHRVSDAIQPSHPLSSPSPPALNLSQNQGLFKWVSSLHQVAKVLEFPLQYQSYQWHPGLISFRMDWLDLLAVQGTLKSLFQHHSSKASILQRSAFFIVQLSHPYMTTGKTMRANLDNSAVPMGLEKVSFHSNPKDRQCQRMLKLPHSCTHLTC